MPHKNLDTRYSCPFSVVVVLIWLTLVRWCVESLSGLIVESYGFEARGGYTTADHFSFILVANGTRLCHYFLFENDVPRKSRQWVRFREHSLLFCACHYVWKLKSKKLQRPLPARSWSLILWRPGLECAGATVHFIDVNWDHWKVFAYSTLDLVQRTVILVGSVSTSE